MCFEGGHLLIMATRLPITLVISNIPGNMGSKVKDYQFVQGFNVSKLLRGNMKHFISDRLYHCGKSGESDHGVKKEPRKLL